MAHAKNTTNQTSTSYSVAADFCRIFAEEMDRLYLLSLLLTANHEKAQQCFTAALDDCHRATSVFKDWASSWARRAIVQNAIKLVSPAGLPASTVTNHAPLLGKLSTTPLAAVLRLDNFARFVYVLSVLERYSDQDCRSLLDSSRQEIVRARRRAMLQLARLAEAPALPFPAGAQQAFAQAS